MLAGIPAYAFDDVVRYPGVVGEVTNAFYRDRIRRVWSALTAADSGAWQRPARR